MLEQYRERTDSDPVRDHVVVGMDLPRLYQGLSPYFAHTEALTAAIEAARAARNEKREASHHSMNAIIQLLRDASEQMSISIDEETLQRLANFLVASE